MITLFHKPSLASSTRIHNLLKQQSAISSSTATQDQASNHYPQNNAERAKPFELEVTEASPTNDQLRSIIDFVGDEDVGKLVAGAHDWKSAQEQLTRDASNLQRPLVRALWRLWVKFIILSKLMFVVGCGLEQR